MQCTEFETVLQDAADRRELVPFEADAPEDAPGDGDWRALRRHAAACPRCRSIWRQFHFVNDALRRWGRQTFDVDLADAVMARWRDERGRKRGTHAGVATVCEPPPAERPGRSGHRLRSAVYAAVIASLLAVLIGPPRWFDPTETTHHPTPPKDQPNQRAISDQPAEADVSPPRAADDTPLGVAPNGLDRVDGEPVAWDSLVENAGTAYRVVAEDTAETWSGVKQLVSAWTPPAGAPGAGTGAPTLPDATIGMPEPWLGDLRRDLQPVGRDMARPLEFLREALPGSSATL